MLLLPFCLFAQDLRVIKGKVIDKSTGESLPGASVYIDKSTIATKTGEEGMIQSFTLGTTTDIDGNFELKVPKNLDVIFCSFISYETQKVSIKNKNYIEINLSDDSKSLSEVIVTGYQTIEKRKLTSSVAKVETKNIIQGGVSSIDQMLGGQLAGVQTTNISGAPGAPAKIRIRGTASLSGSQDPLWVLDGMPLEGTDLPDMSDKNIDQLVNSSIAGLNPNDIADITILKDAAATAIYGARAANGVIVITTKKGKKGRMSVNLNSNTSFVMKPNFDKLNLMNSNEKVDFELNMAKWDDLDDYRSDKGEVARILNKYSQLSAYRTGGFSSISQDAQNEINALRAINTNWGDELYQTSINQDHSLSISGGSDNVNYYFSAGYYNEKGTTIGTGLERLNLTMKADYQLLDNLNVGTSIYYSDKNQESYLTGTDSFTNPSRYSRTANPYLKIRDANGNFIYDKDIDGYEGRNIPFNFIEERENTSNDLKSKNFNAVFDLKWNILKELKLTSQLGVQSTTSNAEQYAGADSYYARKEREKSRYNKGGENFYYLPKGGIIKNYNTEESQWNFKNMLEYNLNIDDIHEIDVMVGNELRRTKYTRINTAGYGYDKQTLTTQSIIFRDANDAKKYPLYSKSFKENAYSSFFATLAYTYNKKYTFFGSVRMDGSDLFGVDPKYRYLPLWAASGSWRAKDEPWLENVEFLSDLKFRASYGLQGNIDKNTSPYIVGAIDYETLLPNNSERTIFVETPPNNKLRWEKTATWNGGFDLGLFKNIIRISSDFYHRKSTDLIGLKAIQLENGFSTTSLNWASVTNKGFEFNIETRNIYTEDFQWRTSLNISKNISNVDRIQIKNNDIYPSKEGYPVNAVFAYKTAGLDEQGFIQFEKDGKAVSASEFFGEEWGSSNLTEEEKRGLFTYIGNTDPEYTGGLINNFSYKNFTLNISCAFNINQLVKMQPFYGVETTDRGVNHTTQMNNVWSPDNKTGIFPRIIGYGTEGYSRASDYMIMSPGFVMQNDVFRDLDIWYKKMSYIRVSSIRLGYNLPTSLMKKCGISSARINVESRNPFVVASNYDGYFDPETYGSIYAQPIPKAFTLGLNVTF